ncbi:hypothetical protein NIES25_48340 [Nostoc linckia NIES-25]|nr:hypothetical protein NIES25_48340 [Nostoc linckia NIES-25]
MTISQQISPSALRAYKLSKYANGQPGRLLLEAKKLKRVTSQFMSRNGAKEAAKSMKTLKKTATTAKKVQDAFFKTMPGGANPKNGGIAGGHLLNIVLQGGLALAVIQNTLIQDFINNRVDDQFTTLNNDLSKNLSVITTLNSRVQNLNKKVDNFNAKIIKELDANAKDYARLNKSVEKTGQDAVAAKKQANDALYEIREGRKIVSGLAESARKLANDTLYEFRQNKIAVENKIAEQRISFDAKIQSINATISKFNNSVSDTFQKSVNATISKLQSDLAATRSQLSAIKPATPTDTAAINANAVAAARALVTPLQSQVGQLNGEVNGLKAQVNQIPVLANSLGSLAKSLNAVDNKADAAMNEARNKGVPNLAPIQQQLDDKFNRFIADNHKALGIQDLEISNLSKDFDKKLADFNRLNSLSSEQRFQEFKRENDKALGTLGLEQSKLSQEFNQKFADFKRQSELSSDQRFEEFQRENKQSLGLLKGDVQQINRDINTTKSDIAKIDTKVREQEKVNSAALPKLDEIINKLPFIPALTAAAIRPDIPTIPQIENAAATGTCRTTQPGGCMRRVLDDNATNITNNNNTNAANILDAINTGANAALLQGQQTILTRLGDQVPGGISGFMNRIVRNQWVDRAINLIAMTAAVHNVMMLSDQAVTTFFSILDNVLAVPALIVDPNAETIDTKQAFGGVVDNFFKNIFGVAEWAEIKTKWATANRIYQAAANGANEVRNIGGNIINAVEQTANLTGKGFNALQDEGLISESNWDYSPENLKLKGGLFAKFGKLADGINIATEGLEAIESITSEIRSAVDSANQIKENAKEVDDGLKELFNQSKNKREEEVEALPAKSYSWEDLI